MASGAKRICVVAAAAALLGLSACSGSDKSSTDAATLPVTRSVEATPEPPPTPVRPDGRMPDEEFAQFTDLDDDIAAGLEQWTADAKDCVATGKGGDLEGFRDCVGELATEADETLTAAGSNSVEVSGQIAAECLEATAAYGAALTNLRAAVALARGFADSLDVKSMPAALQTLANGRKQYKAARAQVRAACDPA